MCAASDRPATTRPLRAAVQLLDLVARAAHLAEHRARAAHERLAHRRQDHAARAALEQRHAKLAFEFVHAARQRRLRQRQVPRGGAQAAAFGDGDHVAQLVELHDSDIKKVSLGLF